jgi:hypothetical protein
MMRRFLVGISTMLVPFVASGSITLLGHITVTDEKGDPFPPPSVGGKFEINFFQQTSGGRVWCATVRVSNSSFQPEEKVVTAQCAGRTFVAEVEMDPDPGWHQRPRPETINCPSDRCGFEVRIVRPRAPSRAQRAANYSRGRKLLSHHHDAALFLFKEAQVGDDFEFAVASANYLEKHHHQADVLALLDTKDIVSLKIPEKNKFQLLVRKANAARVAGENLQAINIYSEALEMKPHNPQAPILALSAAREETGASSNAELTFLVNQDPELRDALKTALKTWRSPGKPRVTTPNGDISKAAIAYTTKKTLAVKASF